MESCPSAKMSASTTTSSPTARLIANRPHSISGSTPRMTTLSGGRSPIFKAYYGCLETNSEELRTHSHHVLRQIRHAAGGSREFEDVHAGVCPIDDIDVPP